MSFKAYWLHLLGFATICIFMHNQVARTILEPTTINWVFCVIQFLSLTVVSWGLFTDKYWELEMAKSSKKLLEECYRLFEAWGKMRQKKISGNGEEKSTGE